VESATPDLAATPFGNAKVATKLSFTKWYDSDFSSYNKQLMLQPEGQLKHY
jgi:hypothetical protein